VGEQDFAASVGEGAMHNGFWSRETGAFTQYRPEKANDVLGLVVGRTPNVAITLPMGSHHPEHPVSPDADMSKSTVEQSSSTDK
jgi:hypothetical protein